MKHGLTLFVDYQNFRGTYCTISHANFLEYDAIQISRVIISVNIYTVEQIGFKLNFHHLSLKPICSTV